MDEESQRKLARAVCEKNRTRREYVALKRRYNLLNRRSNTSSESSGCSSPFVGTPRRVVEPGGPMKILDELKRLSGVPACRRRFSADLIAMAFSVFLLSSAAYAYLRNFLPLPAKQTLYAKMGSSTRLNATRLLNVSSLPDVIQDYREENGILDPTAIFGVLAVDAISFQRELIVSNTGVVQGSLFNETISADRLAELHSTFSEFENFWREHHSALISDAFVFQLQPLNATLRSLVVHISPSSQGQATEKTIELLEQIDACLRDLSVDVIASAMDGDRAYGKLHRRFHLEYSQAMIREPKFANFSILPGKMIISDPLHILKRARYRLLGAQTHVGPLETSPIMNVTILRSLLSLPSKVFSDQKFTKMHDDLAVDLFSLTSLVELFEKKIEYVPYFLPFCLLNAALSEKELTIEERANFLEVSCYYMLAYVQELTRMPVKLPDHKSCTRSDVRPFSLTLAIEYCNTAVSLLSILCRFNGSVNLNRAGTNPLEHTFGAIRMRSRYKHTYDSMIRSIGCTETWKRLARSLGVGSSVSGRKTYYGRTVIKAPTLDCRRCVLPTNARDTVVALHVAFGFPISSPDFESWNMSRMIFTHKETLQQFVVAIETIHRRLHPGMKKVTLNSRSICVTAKSNLCMVKRERELH